MGFVVFIVIVALVLLWPYIMRWAAPHLQNWMMGKMEDKFRRMAGMPTRKEEKRAAKKAKKNGKRAAEAFKNAGRNGREPQGQAEPIIPKDYAEDVEFVEIKTFTQTEVKIEKSDGQTMEYSESQIEDVEFVEFKNRGEEEEKK